MTARVELPPDVGGGVAAALGANRDPDPVREAIVLSGGCIHPAARVDSHGGRRAFLKWARDPGWTGFPVEARGLEALAERGGLRTPRVLGVGAGGNERGWLLLEYVEPGPALGRTAEALGSGLARLHRRIQGARPGWEEDGWIGPLPQRNRPAEPGPSPPTWGAFWREARLVPQWDRAATRFNVSVRRDWDRLMPRVTPVLDEAVREDGLSLLHGDLWSGNVLTARSGEPVIVDPAVYRGHREVDLAMIDLFGGFHPSTLARYREEDTLVPGYAELRRDLYQLYPLLVHVNLFGGGYVADVRKRVGRLAAALASR